MKHKKYHLIYFFSPLFFILSLVSTTTAQTSYLDSLDGKFALQFQISDNFQLSSFQGSTLSGKYHLGKRSAIRLGLSIELNSFEKEETILSDTLNDYGTNRDSKLIGMSLNAQYIYYLAVNDDIAAFGGIGPFFTYQYLNSNEYDPDGNFIYEQKQTNYIPGLDIIFGVEWWFNKSMSLSAEYGLSLSYSSSNYKVKRTYYESKIVLTRWDISAMHVNFGISVYF